MHEAVSFECQVNMGAMECAFREDGVTVQLIKSFFSIHTSKVVRKITAKVVNSVLAKSDLDLELQRDKVISSLQEQNKDKTITDKMVDEIIHKRANILMKFVNVILDKFKGIVSFIPQELRDFVKILKYNLASKPKYFYQLVGGWFFLRAIIPALVSPESYGTLKKSNGKNMTSKNRRNLILIGKVLQNISNEATFGDKEGYLKILQSSASNSFVLLRQTIDEIAKGPITSATREVKPSSKRIDRVRGQSSKLFDLFADEIKNIKEFVLNRDLNDCNNLCNGTSSMDDGDIFLHSGEEAEEKTYEMQELEDIVTASEMNADICEKNCTAKWNVVARRRNSYQRAMIAIQQINDNMNSFFIPSPIRSYSSDIILSLTPREHRVTKTTSEPGSPKSSCSDLSSETTSIITDDISEDLVSISSIVEGEDSVHSSGSNNSINLKIDSSKSFKRILKVKLNSKVVNLSIQQDISLKEVKAQIRSKFSLSKPFGIFSQDSTEINTDELWQSYLENECNQTESVLLYRLFVKLVK